MDCQLLLESLKLHIELTEEDKDFIVRRAQKRKVLKKQYLVHEGGYNRYTNFVNKGCITSYFTDLNGHSHIVQFAMEGWWISDLNSFINKVPAEYNVQAFDDSEVIQFSYEAMEEIYSKIPQMERYFRLITQRAFITFQQRIIQNQSMSAEDRYLAFKNKYPKIELRLPQKMIAQYLGISPEFLSKIKKKLNLLKPSSI